MTLAIAMLVCLLLLTGMGVALLGSLKVTLASRLQIEEGLVGGLVALFGFVMSPVIFAAGFLTDHLGKQGVLIAGSALFAGSLLTLAVVRRYGGALLGVVLFSAAWALLINVGNAMIGELFRDQELLANNMFNVLFGLGAFLTPLLIVSLLARMSWPATLTLLAAFAALPGLLGLAIEFKPAASAEIVPVEFIDLLKDPMMWLLGLALACYGPLEASLGAWTTTYLQGRGLAENRALRLLSGFWLSYMFSRLMMGLSLAAGLTLTPGLARLLLVGLALASVGVLSGMVASNRQSSAISLVLAAGLVLGPIFPTLMSLLQAHFPSSALGRAIGLFFAIGGLGWTFVPMLIGAYANRVGVQRALIIAVAAAIGLVGISIGLAASTTD